MLIYFTLIYSIYIIYTTKGGKAFLVDVLLYILSCHVYMYIQICSGVYLVYTIDSFNSVAFIIYSLNMTFSITCISHINSFYDLSGCAFAVHCIRSFSLSTCAQICMSALSRHSSSWNYILNELAIKCIHYFIIEV